MYHRTRASSVHYPIAKKTKDSNNGMIGLQAELGGPPPPPLMTTPHMAANGGPPNGVTGPGSLLPAVAVAPPPGSTHHHPPPGPPPAHLHPPPPPSQQQLGGRSGGTARERAMHAVEYYNSNVLRARVGAGLAGPRNSVHERYPYIQRHLGMNAGAKLAPQNSENLYRSNSSLELIHDTSGNHDGLHPGGSNLRREYGSHGSIDVISSDRHHAAQSTGESFLAMLQEYRPAVFGMEHSHHHVAAAHHGHLEVRNGAGALSSGEDSMDRGNASPKLRMKFNRLWSSSGGGHGGKTPRGVQTQSASLDDASMNPNVSVLSNVSNVSSTSTTTVSSADIEERQRRRAFAHFDCQSLTANLGYAAKLRGLLLARRRNTTTGASAAATYGTRSSTPDGDSIDEDYGDGQSNELLDSCPFFRNEIGGEEEREVSLTRMQNPLPPGQQRRAIHRPALAYGVSVLECGPNETLWKANTCPYQRGARPIEQIDNGALYYRQHFFSQEHQNWFGMDEQLGPVAISIKREKLPPSGAPALAIHGSDVATTAGQVQQQHLYRLIVRTSELLTLRGSVIEDSIPNPRGPGKHVSTKEILEYVAPEVQISCLRLGVNSLQCEQQLLKLDEQGLTNKYKVGILYCRAGQSSEEDMYNNEEAGPAFNEFLDTIGKRVRLKGFDQYKAGLDNKTDSTGTHSLYAKHQDCEIMFHVSTMLPFTPNNRQQLLRKRHIGNDIVTVVFQEPGAHPFTPKNIRSQFQHVFIVVRAVNPCTEHTQYRVAVSRSKEVPVFGPPVRAGSLYAKGKHFADFLLSKIINAENAAHRSEKFATMATRTRQEYLKDLTSNYCSATVVDTGQKFSIFPSKKRERSKPRFSGDLTQRGAFCWQVVLHDSGQSTQVDCFLGISAETFVLIEECTRQIIFVTPCKAILGWSTSQNSLRVYHHQGECVTLNMRDTGDRDEQLEVIERLRAVTNGCGALELGLRRNPMGQLGFHVQPDGVVTQVEISGQAWTAGLRQGYRLVEICKVAVATLSHDQMVDLLKTSAQVTVTVIESFADFSPRRGCSLQNCRFNAINYESDYDTVPERVEKNGKKHLPSAQLQSANHRRRYERNFSPPRSSNSSGYGTGSSSRSFTALNPNGVPPPEQRYVADMGTLTSSSSGHSSNDDRWYDILEPPHDPPNSAMPPPAEPNNYHHPKLTASSNSLPLAGATPRPLSLHNDSRQLNNNNNNSNGNANVALLKRLIISDNNGHESSPTEPLYSSSMKNLANHHHLSATEEEDHSRHNSPQLKRSATTTNIYGINNGAGGKKNNVNGPMSSSSTSSSRNNSPRPNNGPGETKLRPKSQAPQRNSVNYTGSTLQEDLMKLINPDYIAGSTSDDNFNPGSMEKMQKGHPNSHSLGNISSLAAAGGLKPIPQLTQKSRSREGINLGSSNNLKVAKSNGNVNGQTNGVNQGEAESLSDVIFTTARPATVISSTTSNCSSPASELNNNHNNNNNNNAKLHINEDHLKMSPNRKQQMLAAAAAAGGILKNNLLANGAGPGVGNSGPMASGPGGKIPLPDMKEMDWSSLVDTATKAMTQLTESAAKGHPQGNVYYDDINQVLNGVVQQQQQLQQQQQHQQQQQQQLQHQQQQQQHSQLTPVSHQNGTGTPALSDLSSTPSSASPVSTGSGSTANSAQMMTMQNSSSLPELQSQVSQLSDRVLREQRRRRSLEHAVRRLTEENRRLQDESQAAVQQLRRFTEWFFQTIDRQS